MKLKPDFKSINFKTFVYFVLFAAVILILLWSLQVIFLNNFYGIMKSSQTKIVARELQRSYVNHDRDEFLDDVGEHARSFDLDCFVFSYSAGIPVLVNAPGGGGGNKYGGETLDYSEAVGILYSKIQSSGTGSAELDNSDGDIPNKMFAYAVVLSGYEGGTSYEDSEILYVFSPLRPVASTQRIMTTILIYVTIISLILAIIISFYLSTRITRPIRMITKSADKLAHGEYGVVFKGGHYTEINQLADTLNSASIELEKSDMKQKDLIANVSHDLRTPLTMIRSYAEMIRDISGDDRKKREAHLQVIMDESDRLNSLVEDLLAVSRLQSGKLSIEPGEFSISEAVTSTMHTYRIMEEEEDYHFEVDVPMNYIVFGDEEKIRQVLINLITNAIKFAGDDKYVGVSLSKKGRSIRCSVTDHGKGIAEEDLDHIWERYYRSSSNMTRSQEGSGLGLAIVKEILTLHSCTYGVDSTLGEGSTFWFEMDVLKTERLPGA